MNSQTVQIGRFTGIPVAEGGFATVYRAFDDLRGVSVAMKLAHPDADDATIASLHHEFKLLGEFDYMQVPRALEFEWDHRRPCLITDWIDGPEIWDRSHTNSVELFVTSLRQIARALTFVHHRGWVHGDLKPGNFRWGAPRATSCRSASANEADSILYLLDFGLARPVGDTDRPRGAGTVGYYAPEFLQRIPADGRADWYSIGAMLYEWVYGRRPFQAENPADEIAGHLEQSPNLDMPFVRSAPEWTRDAIARLLQKSPEQRGDDVYDLLGWLGQFDSELCPEVILNEQASAHLSSEWRQTEEHDHALIAQIVDDSMIHRKARWTIRADHVDTDRIARGITNAVLEKIPGSRVTLGQLNTAPITSEAAQSDIQQLRICVEESNGGQDISTVEFAPFANLATSESGPSEAASVCSITLLPWGLELIKDRLSGLTRDDAFVAASAPTILRATGGVPAAVFDFLTRVVTTGMLKRSAEGWQLDDSAIRNWQTSPETGRVYNEYLGSLTADERRLCDVLSVGRGLIQFSHLREIAGLAEGRFDVAFGRLAAKGVLVHESHDAAGGSSLIELRLNGLADVWRAQLPETYRRSIAASVAERLRSIGADRDRRTFEVLAECYADSAQWEQCVEYSVAAAHANIKIEDHTGAWQYIGLAESAAGNISDQRSNAYWRGRALMVRGDYQKSVGQIDDARHVYREILALGRHHKDYLLLAETLKDLGDLYRITRQFEKGVRVLRRARQMWETLGNPEEAARTLINLGNMFWIASDRLQARRHYEQALELARALQADELVALILSNLGVAYKGDRDYNRAEAFYRESLAIKEAMNSLSGAALTLNNLGVIAFDQGRLTEAAQYFERAAQINARMGAAGDLLGNRGMLIHIALERGDLRTVINGSLEALADAETLGDAATSAELRGLLAEAYLRAGDFQLSWTYLEEARDQAAGQRNDELTAHLGLVAAVRYWHLGQGDQALMMLDEIEQYLARSEFPHLLMDSLSLRMRAAVAYGNTELIERLWEQGLQFATSVGAGHKLAQLAFARLPENPDKGFPGEAHHLVYDLLLNDDGYYWSAAFKMWEARRFVAEGNLPAARQIAADAVARLRKDGNWETLWKVLTVMGRIEFQCADYGPALTAFDEASRILEAICNTIADPACRASYRSHPLATQLLQAKEQILELTR